MKISVPNSFSEISNHEHLIHRFEWPRLLPESVRWVDTEIDDDLLTWGLGSKALLDFAKRERRFLSYERKFFFKPDVPSWVAENSESRTYRPLDEHPSLFKVFGDLDGSEESFVSFAAKYGHLGIALLPSDSEEMKEPFCVWHLIWQDISECSRLLDYVQSGNVTELRKLVTFGEKNVILRPPGYEPKKRFVSQVGAVALNAAALLPGMPPDERWFQIKNARSERARLLLAARFWIKAKVNRWVGGTVFPETSVRCVVISDQGTFGLRFWPTDLASAMWLQMGRALEGDIAYRQCKSPRCRKWFVVSSNRSLGRRTDSRYCGDPKCRKEVFRQRQLKRSKR